VPAPGKPVILASNHSGSFFDAVVIGAVLEQPIHTLTRGDVFRKPSVAKWLRRINLIPVFRASEGLRDIKNNDATFEESYSVIKKGEAVLIFSEGISVNEWHLKPLGKGTARMAYQTWFGSNPIKDMVVIPTGVTYEHFRGTDKRVKLIFGDPIDASQLTTPYQEQEKWLREFNHLLFGRMKTSLLHIEKGEDHAVIPQKVQEYFADCPAPINSGILSILGKLGRAIHQPVYRLYVNKVNKMTRGTVFYDSVLFGLLVYTYPVLILLLSVLAGSLSNIWTGLAVFAGLPLLALLGNRYR
jgi:1-acyl-sn-glycerol-3-phosphate acyltransferase